jgi:hypothetical protein
MESRNRRTMSVRARVALINSLRFTLKSLGYSIANPSTERFHKVIQTALRQSLAQVIAPSAIYSDSSCFVQIRTLTADGNIDL